MDVEKIKEDLSICYLKAIAAVRGIALERIEHDEDSVDVFLKKIITLDNGLVFNSQISVQLKATSSSNLYSINEDIVSYQLKVKNYNNLCTPAAMPSILGLLILPAEQDDWVQWNEEELLLKGQMYWIGLMGREKSNNAYNITVKIPKENRLNGEALEYLLKKAAEEGCI